MKKLPLPDEKTLEYRQGVNAFMAGLQEKDCPHSLQSKRKRWTAGYYDALYNGRIHAQVNRSKMSAQLKHLVSAERLQTLLDDPLVGRIIIGRMLVAWRTSTSLKIGFSGDTIFQKDNDGTIHLHETPVAKRSYLCRVWSEVFDTLGLRGFTATGQRGRLVVNYNGQTYIGNSRGALAFPVS